MLSECTPQLLDRINAISQWFANVIFANDGVCGVFPTHRFSTRYHFSPVGIAFFPYVEKYDFYSTLIARDLFADPNFVVSDDVVAQYIVFNSYLVENDFAMNFNSRKNTMLPVGIGFEDIVKHFSIDMLYLLALLIYDISHGGDNITSPVLKKIFALLKNVDLANPLLFPKMYVANHGKFIDLCMASAKAGCHSPLISFFETSFINKANTINFRVFEKLLTSFNKSIGEKTAFDINMH